MSTAKTEIVTPLTYGDALEFARVNVCQAIGEEPHRRNPGGDYCETCHIAAHAFMRVDFSARVIEAEEIMQLVDVVYAETNGLTFDDVARKLKAAILARSEQAE